MKRGKNKNFHHALIFIPKRPLKVANGTHLPLPLRSASMTDYIRNESDPPSLKMIDPTSHHLHAQLRN